MHGILSHTRLSFRTAVSFSAPVNERLERQLAFAVRQRQLVIFQLAHSMELTGRSISRTGIKSVDKSVIDMLATLLQAFINETEKMWETRELPQSKMIHTGTWNTIFVPFVFRKLLPSPVDARE